jgi:hypothetical protein
MTEDKPAFGDFGYNNHGDPGKRTVQWRLSGCAPLFRQASSSLIRKLTLLWQIAK